MMRVLASAIFMGLIGLSLAQTYGLKDHELDNILPVNITKPKEKPDHGVCYIDDTLRCQTPGDSVDTRQDDGCTFCFCGENLDVVCCKNTPYPNVADPYRCYVYLDNNLGICKYRRDPKCKPRCELIGWFYSEYEHLIPSQTTTTA